MQLFVRALPLVFALAFTLAGCGPIGSTNVIGDAEIAVARAHASDGEKYAIYETTSADLYLEKAREEQGHAHYGAAMELAKKSQELAEAASTKAGQARTVATPPPLPKATVTHAAGETTSTTRPPVIASPPESPPVLITPAPQPPPASAPVIVPAPNSSPPPSSAPSPVAHSPPAVPSPIDAPPDAGPVAPRVIMPGKTP